MNPLRSAPLCLLVAEASGENRFQKFLMMGMMGGGRSMTSSPTKEKKAVMQRGSDATDAVSTQVDPSCVDSGAVIALQSQLEAAIKAQGDAETKRSSLSAQVKELQALLDRLSIERKSKEEELTRALNAAISIREKAVRDRDEMAEDVKMLKDRRTSENLRHSEVIAERESRIQQLEAEIAEKAKKSPELADQRNDEKLQKSRDIERELRAQLDDEKKKLEALEQKHHAMQVECNATEKVKDADVESQVQKRVESEIRRAKLEADQKCQAELAQAANNTKVAVEEARARAERLLEQQQAQAELHLKELAENSARERQVMASKHAQEVMELQKELKAIDSERKQLETEKAKLVESLTELDVQLRRTQQESMFWKDAFESRSVFNLTHFADTAHVIVVVTFELANAAIAPGCEYWADVYEQLIKSTFDSHVRPHIDQAYQQHVKPRWSALYDGHLKQHVDEIKETVHSSVVPVASTLARQRQMATDSSYEMLNGGFRNACLHTLSFVKRIHGPPDKVERLTWTCDNPERGLESLASLLFLLTVTLFGRSIIRMSLRIVVWLVLLLPRTVGSILALPPANEPDKKRAA